MRVFRSRRFSVGMVVAAVLTLLSAPAAQASTRDDGVTGCWQHFASPTLTDVEIGANGSIWAMGSYNEAGGGWEIYQWTGSSWVQSGRYGLTIAVSPTGQPWYVDLQNRIFRLAGGGWEQLPGAATNIDIGADGSVWVTGNVQFNADGFGIYRWNGTGWDQIDGTAQMINVDRFGQPWIVTSWGPGNGNVYRRFGNSWILIPPNGTTWDMGIGGGDAVWRVVYTPSRGHNSLERWNGAGWTWVGDAADRVSVDHLGRAWRANWGQIYYWTCA